MKLVFASLLFVAPALAAPSSPAELEAFERTNVAPKIDLMCGTQLDVHIDASLARAPAKRSLGVYDARELCEAPLRWMFLVCSKEEGRRILESAKVRRYECRLTNANEPESLTFSDGKLAVAWKARDADVSDRLDDLSRVFQASRPATFVFSSHVVGPDKVWDAFVAKPTLATSNENYCEVDGKRGPLPPSGDPLAPKTARVHCVSNGAVVTDLVPEPGGYTGFATVIEDDKVTHTTWRRGRLDGEHWIRRGKIVLERSRYLSGTLMMSAFYDPKTGQLHTRDFGVLPHSHLELDEQGHVTNIQCAGGAEGDEVFRDYCGYDKPRKVTLRDSGGLRTVTFDHGAITSP